MVDAIQNRETRRFPPAVRVSLAVSALLLVYLYGFHGNAEQVESQGRSAILWMTVRWSGKYATDLSFGWLIPLVAALAVWRRRAALARAPAEPDARGLLGVALALALYWAGVQGQQTRLTLFSLLVLLWTIPFALWGWQTARQLVFPAAYLVFCIPLSFLDNLTFPLRLFAARFSAGTLNGLGIGTLRTGTALQSTEPGGFLFDVADPCSGLRYILALTALTAAYAFFTQKGLWRQWLLFLSAFPIAVAGNIIRIVTVGIASRFFGQEWATGFYHDYSGYLFFLAVGSLVLGAARLLNQDWIRQWKNLRITFRA